jgi:hypothetical protein
MKSRTLTGITAVTLFAALAVPALLAAQNNQDRPDARFITFDVPGGLQGTFAQSINPAGAIAGYYLDRNFVAHGFLRVRDGAITTFDVPGAGKGIYEGTIPQSINPAGAIAGYYPTTNGVIHGFLRARDGAITTFDVSAAGVGQTVAASINPAGAIAGYYSHDASHVNHGFLRIPCSKGDVSDQSCEDNAVGATVSTQRSPAPITQGASTVTQAK